ncbi:MAG: heavy-metal-associated domain-containing protein [Planctomycetes bacterium]|nr:heavy-metal-associated domain-containing protein [Planctomycetota bacterium]
MKALCLVTLLAFCLPATLLADCPSCTVAKEKDGWCDSCKVGYIGGEAVKCRSCFDLRTSGKSGWCEGCKVGHAKGLKTSCKSCLAAIDSDGWCDDCKVGYAAGQKTNCRGCHAAMKAADGGWCDDCKVGYAKGVKTKCKSCLEAIRVDGWCDDCKAGYVAARKTGCRSCYAAMKEKDGGWCDDCKVGYARGLKTSCKSCLEAIRKDGSCADCGKFFEGGVAYKVVDLHVHDLKDDSLAKKAGVALEKLDGVARVNVNRESGHVSLGLAEGAKTNTDAMVKALKEAGFEAHPGKE